MYGVVKEVERLSPGMIRVVLSDGDLDGFESTGFTDEYVNAFFVPDGAPYEVPFTPEDIEEVDAEHRPKPRRYTVREWDAEQQHLTIDFVAHGDVGYAGRWAQRATPGDRLQFRGPGGGYAPNPEAGWHLLVGDESALPAIAASLERLPAGARAITILVVDGPEYEQPLDSPADVDVVWLHRKDSPQPENLLPDAVAAIEFPDGQVDIFVHGEAGEVRDVRKHLLNDREVDISGSSISPYWRRNHDDESWRAIKSQWLAEQAADG
ncbi:MAG: siderophore-interacting protein [Actinomycetota bacterium]